MSTLTSRPEECERAVVPANARVTVAMLPFTAVTSMCSQAVHLPVLVVVSQMVAIMLGTNPVPLASTIAV